jgi:murein DD-endopeptidase MepM/ murein hydrolase activator NlpD
VVLKRIRFILPVIIGILVIVGALIYSKSSLFNTIKSGRHSMLREYLRSPQEHAGWSVQAGARCGDAPFMIPTDGYVGYLWGDSFRPGHHHQGIDIFGGRSIGETRVVAAHDGYLTRLADWKSSVIIRIPSDPLQPDRQIWIYYTHMADPQGNSFISSEFPPDTHEAYVTEGTLIGYQGDYSGDPNNPTGIHLHFSIVRDDGSGGFLNELDIKSTIDPSSYFQMTLNADENYGDIPQCGNDQPN